jgi:hypothetical protein
MNEDIKERLEYHSSVLQLSFNIITNRATEEINGNQITTKLFVRNECGGTDIEIRIDKRRAEKMGFDLSKFRKLMKKKPEMLQITFLEFVPPKR